MRKIYIRATPALRALCFVGVAGMTAQLLLLRQPAFASEILRVVWDKAVHFLYFGTMAFLLWVGTTGRRALAIWGLVALIGATDEWQQAFTPGRTSEFDDWLADGLGAASFLVVARQVVAVATPATARTLFKNGG